MELDEKHIISTPKGYRTVSSLHDIADILDENDLSELKNLINSNIIILLSDKEELIRISNSELASYEAQNEEYHDTIRDSAEAIEELLDSINDSKRLNRLNLVNTLTDIFDGLWSVL